MCGRNRRHTEAVDAIARHLRMGSYASWPEERRVDFLLNLLSQNRRLPLDGIQADARVADVFATCRMLTQIPRDSLGAYVITQAGRASDVLAVELLQREAGVERPLRGPAVRNGRDLRAAADVMNGLLSIPWYRTRVMRDEGRQEVMVGYSDSAKEIGRLAAAWELYKAQETIVSACRDHDVPITLFHGRGGSVGRGGGPTYLAIQSQPPGSVDGTLRVTEQGEMIQAKFGLPGIAVRTLEVYATATLEATLARPRPVDPRWRATMNGSPARRAVPAHRLRDRGSSLLRWKRKASRRAPLAAARPGEHRRRLQTQGDPGVAWTQTGCSSHRGSA